MKTQITTIFAAACLIAGCGSEAENPQSKTQTTMTEKPSDTSVEPSRMAGGELLRIAPLRNTAGDKIGTVTVNGGDAGGVRLSVIASEIPAGTHGMHFHEKADCSSADFKSAGGHINPMGVKHGLKNPDGPDNADMENAVADADGNVDLKRMNPRLSMTGQKGLPALLDDNGSALVIHANPDDQITQPIGGAGARIACAEIGKP